MTLKQRGSKTMEKKTQQAKTPRTNTTQEQTHTVTAHDLAKQQREISVAEFFAKNRHLLGFDNPRKALLTTIKEAVDNSLDACEEAHVLPEIIVEAIEMSENRFRVIVEDNGPGIVKEQIPKIFAKLLYGSKFHRLKMSRGQQGIGISASVMYGQLTTGRAAKITSKIHPNEPAQYYELHIDTQTNQPKILKESIVDWHKDRGTRVEIDLEATYSKGSQSIDAYLKQTAIVNPHATIIYTNPRAEQLVFSRATEQLPPEAKEIKPHPYGVELGLLQKLLGSTTARTMQSFLTTEFSRVTPPIAKEICEHAGILVNVKPEMISREQAERIIAAFSKTKIMAPPSDCISPIGAELLEKGLKKEVKAEFYCATTRPPSVYRGNPFIVEAAMAYGGEMQADDMVRLYRYANRVPLQYQQSACAITASVIQTNFRQYGLQQSKGALPVGPCAVVVHIASVWVPFTSESKEAIAHYPEMIKDIKLAIQECGRQLARYVLKKQRLHSEMTKRSYIEKYIPAIGTALKELLSLPEAQRMSTEENLKELLEQKRGALAHIEASNEEYNEEFALVGKTSEEDIYEDDAEQETEENSEDEK
ncbi:DNA topoisomerase VI subunit B [Candidatus Woesearchaeota archaeon]|nr:DNA topoisomerase VI subunit B [Candidatus Woesearchaeota archaeon]